MKRIAILSDTHDVLLPKVQECLKDCDIVLHAGDFTKPEILDWLRSRAAVYVVKGNCDDTWAGILRTSLEFQIEQVHFCMAHRKADLPRSTTPADVMIYGHTHLYHEEYKNGILWLNPGTAGISRFGLESTMVLMTVEGGAYQIRKVVVRREQ